MQPYYTAVVGGHCKSSLKIKESVSVMLKFVTFVSFSETQSDCAVEAALKCDPPASASQVLGSQECATMTS